MVKCKPARSAQLPAKLSAHSSAHSSAVWGRNRDLCVNMLIHGHLCVCGFGRCRRDAHRYTFISQDSVRNWGHGPPQIAGLDGTPRRPIHRTSGRDGPEQRGEKSLMSIHRSHICHIGGADQGHFSHPTRNPQRPGTDGRLKMGALGHSHPAGGRADLSAALPPTAPSPANSRSNRSTIRRALASRNVRFTSVLTYDA